jgi:pimeloyl-ACP methyl ester carboxylesterase
MRTFRSVIAVVVGLIVGHSFAQPSRADDGDRLLRVDHYVVVKTTVPVIAGQMTEIYVREVVRAHTVLRSAATPVVLFIHGGGTPSEVAFDTAYRDYSWMAYLARAGFDVFSMDNIGYGRSTRPAPMSDPCNLSAGEQRALVPGGQVETCSPSYGRQLTTIDSDWNDIGAVVDHLLALRHVSQVSVIAWSFGGPRAGGYAARHPEKVQKLLLLAPLYVREISGQPPEQVPAIGAAMSTQSHDELTAAWNSQVGCAGQVNQALSDTLWPAMLATDPVGATWGSGVRRAPVVTNWGWNAAMAAATHIPTLMVTGEHDKTVLPMNVHELYADIGSKSKVLIDIACSSHYPMWEKNHLLLFQASVEWLTKGTVNGVDQGIVRLGY